MTNKVDQLPESQINPESEMQNFVGIAKAQISKKEVQACILLALKALKKIRLRNKKLLGNEITFVFVSSLKMKNINFQYRKKNKVTDVLSFPAGVFDLSQLGEIVLCPEEIKKRGKANGLTYREELSYNIVHGILHLLGYDHEVSKGEEKIMFDIQDRIFDQYFRL